MAPSLINLPPFRQLSKEIFDRTSQKRNILFEFGDSASQNYENWSKMGQKCLGGGLLFMHHPILQSYQLGYSKKCNNC